MDKDTIETVGDLVDYLLENYGRQQKIWLVGVEGVLLPLRERDINQTLSRDVLIG